MCATVLRPLCAFALLLSLASPMLAAKYKASDYPLRVHVVFRNGNRHYHGLGGGASTLDEVDGLGQAISLKMARRADSTSTTNAAVRYSADRI